MEKKIFNIVLLGAGELGSRHLQSLKKLELDVNLYVIDLSEESLNLAKTRYEQIPENIHIKSIQFFNDILSLPKIVDLLVLATGANKRADIIKKVVSVCHVENMIIEKVLFQDLDSYYEIEQLLKDKEIKAWVNCTRREQEGYKLLKKRFGKGPIYAVVDGSNWGIGCNAIHFIDIISYLSDCDNYTISTDNLDSSILDSKRKGYIEMTGMLKIEFSDKSVLLLSSRNQLDTPYTFTIASSTVHYIINELQNSIMERTIDSKYIQSDFGFLYQSDLTHLVAYKILVDGKCNLTTYEQSMKLHLPFIKALLQFINRQGIDTRNCPIT